MYGSHDANWLGFYDYFGAVCGLADKVKKITGLVGIGRTAGWWWPFKGAVILTERPRHLSRDAQGRLHCEDRAAIEYPDGWGVHAWHGTRVPAAWIEQRTTLDAATVLQSENLEQRRAGCEIIGWAKVLETMKAEVVDEDGDPEIGTLLRVSHEALGEPVSQFLRVRCGTGRDFVLRVPPSVKTALEGNAWTWDLKATQYKPEARA